MTYRFQRPPSPDTSDDPRIWGWFNEVANKFDRVNSLVADVRDYGAFRTDDQRTETLNRAFAETGYKVRLAPENWQISAGLTEPTCAGIIGHGPDKSKITAATGITKVLSLGSECTYHQGYQIVGNATNSAIGILCGDAESGAYFFEDVYVKSFTGTGAIGWKFYQALKTVLLKCLGQGNYYNYEVNGVGTGGFPTSVMLFHCGNIDATRVGIRLVHGETFKLIGGFSDDCAYEAILADPYYDLGPPEAFGSLTGIMVAFHRFESNAASATYQCNFDASAHNNTLRLDLLDLEFTSASKKSVYLAGSATSYTVNSLKTATNTSGELTVRSGAYGTTVLHPSYGAIVDDNTGLGFVIGRGQLKFPSTQNASTDANTFDDYVKFDWTPALTFSTPGDFSVAYTTQIGRGIKKADEVTVHFTIVTSTFTHTTAAGNLHITGLPYTSENVASQDHMGSLSWQGITKANYTDIKSRVAPNNAIINLYASGSGQAIAVIAAADMPTGGTVILVGTLSYRV